MSVNIPWYSSVDWDGCRFLVVWYVLRFFSFIFGYWLTNGSALNAKSLAGLAAVQTDWWTVISMQQWCAYSQGNCTMSVRSSISSTFSLGLVYMMMAFGRPPATEILAVSPGLLAFLIVCGSACNMWLKEKTTEPPNIKVMLYIFNEQHIKNEMPEKTAFQERKAIIMIHELLMKKFISVASSHFKYSSIHPSNIFGHSEAVCNFICVRSSVRPSVLRKFLQTQRLPFSISVGLHIVGISNMEWDDVIKLITFIRLMGQPANSQYLKLPLRQSRSTNWSLSHLGNVTFGEHLRSLIQINFKDTSVPCWTIPRFTVITKWITPHFLQSSMQPTIHPASHPHQRST